MTACAAQRYVRGTKELKLKTVLKERRGEQLGFDFVLMRLCPFGTDQKLITI